MKYDWNKASKKEIDDEFYRMLMTMPRNDLVDVVIGLITYETKLDFVKQWHKEDEK